MIVAIPKGPQSGVKNVKNSLRWQVEDRYIIERHGFMTYPQFLDNGFVAEKGPNIKWLEMNLKRYGNGLIRFAVAPDNMPGTAEKLRREYDVEWIYPLHSRDEDFSNFDWVGMPHREDWRDYDLKTFLKLTEGKKRWYLGFWDETNPEYVLLFDGFDTRIPDAYASKYGKMWLGWGKARPVDPMIPLEEVQEYNLLSFKIALRELIARQAKIQPLTFFLGEIPSQSQKDANKGIIT